MLDHVTLRVRDLAAAKAFYAAALRPLGYLVGKEFPGALGLGAGGLLDLWLVGDPESRPQHLAFAAATRAAVDAFHAAALAAGGTDNGPPGLRLDYHPTYYAAFAFDPSGHNVEVVCHRAPGAGKPAATGRKAAKAATRKPTVKKLARGRKGASRLARKPTARKHARGRR